MPHTALTHDRVLPFALVISTLLTGFWLVPKAWADIRFGDSTWVAPGAPSDDPEGPARQGPRVAEPDHERGWETALRAPFRLAFLPLRLVARGAEKTVDFLEGVVPRGTLTQDDPSPAPGLRLSPAVSYSGAASLGLGATVSAREFAGRGSRFSTTGTWSLLDNRRARARFLFGEGVSAIGAGVEALYDYRPNRRFYGVGNDAAPDRTIYLRRDLGLEGSAFAGRTPERRLRALAGISSIRIGNGYNGGTARHAADVFSPAEVPFLQQGSRAAHAGLAGDFASVDRIRDPSRGVHLRADGRRYQGMGALDRDWDAWRLEGRGYLPVMASRRVIALRGVLRGIDARDGSDPVPFYRLAESSEQDRFAAYSSGRFRDRRLLLLHAEYRWIIWERVWAVALAQRGMVAGSNRELRYADMHESYGGGLRFRMSDTRTARLELATGADGLRAYLDLKGDF